MATAWSHWGIWRSITLTFEDRLGTARFNGETTVALQVVKRKGFNIIDTLALVRETVDDAVATWPEELRKAVTVGSVKRSIPPVAIHGQPAWKARF